MLYEYPAKILGVYPAEPGYALIGIKPQGLYMGNAKGSIDTPKGMVDVAWEYRNKAFSITGKIPPNGKALITLPDGSTRQCGDGPFSFTG
jgi:alpha-L-rhamnosidase